MNIQDRGFYASLTAVLDEPPQRFRQTIICYDKNGKAKKITTCNSITRGWYWLRSKLPGFGYKDVHVLNAKEKECVQLWSEKIREFVESQSTTTASQIHRVFLTTVANERQSTGSAAQVVRELCQIAAASRMDDAPLPFAEKISAYLGEMGVSKRSIHNFGKDLSIVYGTSDNEVYIRVCVGKKGQHYYIDQNGGMQKASAVYDRTNNAYAEQPRESFDDTNDVAFLDVVDLVIANMG